MSSHIINGEFQSDKYPSCPPGKVPLSVKDPMAQDLLWEYAQRRRSVDAEFSADLETALRSAGYEPPTSAAHLIGKAEELLKVLMEARAKLKAHGILGAEFSRGIDEHVAAWLMRELAMEFERGVQSVAQLHKWSLAAESLWQLLDDIDSLGDAMHPELTPYFMAVQARASRRHEWLETDGYRLALTVRP